MKSRSSSTNRNSQLLHEKAVTEEEILSEENLRRVEAEPGFRQMMEDSIEAEREGRVYAYREVKEALRSGDLKGLMQKRRREWRQRV
jgi:hypothetical protein